MAALTRFTAIRSIVNAPYWRRPVSVSTRYFASGTIDGAQEQPTPRAGGIASDVEQATGLEKKEIDALMAGIEDPFNMSVNRGPRGTKDKPTLVPSVFGERIVGCICEEDATYITWMKLSKGEAKRCECGYWYKLIEANPNKV